VSDGMQKTKKTVKAIKGEKTKLIDPMEGDRPLV